MKHQTIEDTISIQALIGKTQACFLIHPQISATAYDSNQQTNGSKDVWR